MSMKPKILPTTAMMADRGVISRKSLVIAFAITVGMVISDSSRMIPITLIDSTMAMAMTIAIMYAISVVLMP